MMRLSEVNKMVANRVGQGTPHNTGINCSSDRKHTPIMSKAQQGLFGAELARRRKGLKPKMRGITGKELVSHLKESKGKKLSKKVGG